MAHRVQPVAPARFNIRSQTIAVLEPGWKQAYALAKPCRALAGRAADDPELLAELDRLDGNIEDELG